MYRFSEISLPPVEFLRRLPRLDYHEPARFWWDGIFWEIESQPDEWPDIDFYGRYSSSTEEYWGDRKTGNLYGPLIEETRSFSTEEEAEKFINELEADENRQIYWSDLNEEDTEKGTIYTVHWSEYELLSTDGPANWGRNDYEYYIPSSNHIPPGDPKNWGSATDPRYPTPKDADIAYIIEDWKRWENYGQTWESIIWFARIYDGPLYEAEIASSSVGGIESEYGSTYEIEALQEVMHEALYEAGFIGNTAQWPEHSEPILYLVSEISTICNVVERIIPNQIIIEERDKNTLYSLTVQLSCEGDPAEYADLQRIETKIEDILNKITEFGFEIRMVVRPFSEQLPEISIWIDDISQPYSYNLILQLITEEWLEEHEVEIPSASPVKEEPILHKTSIWQQMRSRGYPQKVRRTRKSKKK